MLRVSRLAGARRVARRPGPGLHVSIRRAIALCAALAGAVTPLALAASGSRQEAGSACTDDEPGCGEGFEEQIVVTATRTPVPRGEIGSTIDVIRPEDALARSGRLVTDLLTRVPGVDVRRTGGPGAEVSIFLRGADSDHTLVLVDGVELNDPSTPARTPFATHLDVDGVERIEVLRGPQSTIWGSDAIGGVVNIVTSRADGPGRLRLWTEAGSYSSTAGGFGWSGRVGASRVSLTGSRTETGGFSQSSSGAEDDPYERDALTASIEAPLGARVTIEASARHADALTAFDGFFAEGAHEVDATQTLSRVALTVGEGERFVQRIGLRHARSRRATSGSFPSNIRGRLSAAEWLGTWDASPRHELTFGASLEEERADFRSFAGSARTVAAFVQDRVTIRRGATRWSGTIGARVDGHETFGAETTVRAAGAWQRGERGPVVRASIGTGFKAPSIAELDPRAFGGNPDLDPETSTGADLGIEWTTPGGRATLGATLFANRFRDLIVAVFDPSTFLFRNVNVDEAEARGIEASAFVVVAPRIGIGASYTHTRTEAIGSPAAFGLSDGGPLLRRPERKGSLHADWRFGPDAGRGAGRLALSATHTGERKDLDPVTFLAVDAPSWTVADLGADVALGGTLTLRARLENLTDERYEDVLGFATPGRSAYVGIALDVPLGR